jgi:diguanylate cyclase (GGDEF)-like protein
MVTTVDTPVPAAEACSRPHKEGLRLHHPTFIAVLFGLLILLQAAGYLTLGTGRAGMGFSESVLVLQNLLALACAWTAFRRAQGALASFWLLFFATLIVLLVPAIILMVSTVANVALVSVATWRVLYCFYGTPILMMLLLPASEHDGRHKSEVYLDLFQVTIVTCLGFYTFFYLPLQRMLPDDALLRNLDLSNLESVFLLSTVLVRLRTVRAEHRDPLFRLGLFVVVCAVTTYTGNWIDAHHLSSLSAWWDLGWAVPYVTAGLVAIAWSPTKEPIPEPGSWTFTRFLVKNLVLVVFLVCVNAIVDHWPGKHGSLPVNFVLAAFLLMFTVRLALTQYYQQQEIAERKRAQQELSNASETIANLLDEARAEASNLAQIDHFGGLLQACTSRDEALRVLPEQLSLLLPGTSGQLSIMNTSRTHAEPVARWGSAPWTQSPSGTAAASPPMPPLSSQNATIPIPLIANGEAVGVLQLQHNRPPREASADFSQEFDRQTQLAYSVAEHIALTLSNLDLREALREEAIRDPLTGLYNRRHMQESLTREIHRAHRRGGSLAVLMLDIDHFKRYNDTFGHAAGDDALRMVAETLTVNVRAEDLACRYGGEEMIVLMPDCTLQNAAERADQIRLHIKNLHVESEGELPAEVTASIGVAAFPTTTSQSDLLLKCADEALYRAKHEGRDRVVAADTARASSAATT